MRYTQKEQVLIMKVLHYFQLECDTGHTILPVTAVQDRVCNALGISKPTLIRIKNEGVTDDKEFQQKTQSARCKDWNDPQHVYQKVAVRNRIYAMYEKGEHITMRTLLKTLKDVDGINLSYCVLHQTLRKIHFKWQKCSVSNRKFLMEQSHVVDKRITFLREFTANQALPVEQQLQPIYLDETWFYSKSGFRKSWQDGTIKAVKHKTGEGLRYVVLHAGSESGFVRDASLCFKSGNNTGDYHLSMNADNFEKWFEEKLLINLEEPSLIIMDNASYHSRLVNPIPNKSWNKSNLTSFLKENNISFPELAMKDQIWDIVRLHLPDKRYIVDELALKYGHKVLRLPPYHCQYNPIELVWSDCKRFYDANIGLGPFSVENILNKWQQALGQVTPTKWKNYVQHTKRFIEEDWVTARRIDASDILPVIINLGELSDSEVSINDDDNP